MSTIFWVCLFYSCHFEGELFHFALQPKVQPFKNTHFKYLADPSGVYSFSVSFGQKQVSRASKSIRDFSDRKPK